MFFSDQIILQAASNSFDTYGDISKSYTNKTVNADVKSATRSEFYAADTAGRKIDIVFVVHVEDYSNQRYVTYSSAQYEVVRAYQKGLGVVELSCVKREG